MPYPTVTFSTITQWENYVNTYWVTNGSGDITGAIGNAAVNGAITFVKKSPLNWNKAKLYSAGGAVTISDSFLGVVIFSTSIPSSLSFGNNFYNQYVFINMTEGEISLSSPSGYYDVNGAFINVIPANSAVVLYKAENDIWVKGNTGGGGGGSTQKEPKTYVVGVDDDAPVDGGYTWQLGSFENSYVILFVNGFKCNQKDAGNGNPFISKLLTSDELTINNYEGGWKNGDVLDYILITP